MSRISNAYIYVSFPVEESSYWENYSCSDNQISPAFIEVENSLPFFLQKLSIL
jgi:hypothetical protein